MSFEGGEGDPTLARGVAMLEQVPEHDFELAAEQRARHPGATLNVHPDFRAGIASAEGAGSSNP